MTASCSHEVRQNEVSDHIAWWKSNTVDDGRLDEERGRKKSEAYIANLTPRIAEGLTHFSTTIISMKT